MSQPYGYAGQPPYQQGGYYPQSQNAYQPPPPQPGWNTANTPAFGSGVPMGASDGFVGDDPSKRTFGFDSQSVRRAFVRKVFTLVAIMLAVVTVMCAIPFLNPDMKAFVGRSPGIYFASYFVFLIVYFTIMCCESVRRSFPSNLIATSLLTLSIGYMSMMLCTRYSLDSVLLCLIITTVCCGGIVVFSMTTKHDLTSAIGIIFILSMVLLVFGLVAVVALAVFHVRWLYTVYAALAALIFMFYLAIDVQSIMGGRKIEISPEEHIFAAVQIFLDIVYIFWMILQLIGSRD